MKRNRNNITSYAIGFGLLVVALDVGLDFFVFYEGDVWDRLLLNVPTEIYMRSLMVVSLAVFGVIVSRLVSKLDSAKQAALIANEQLRASEHRLQESADALDKSNWDLRERVKELNCLYGLSRLVEQKCTEEQLFLGLVNLIPASWQYPENTCARIVFEGKEYLTDNFRKTHYCQSANIMVNDEMAGTLEVYRLEAQLRKGEDAFLKEEEDLIALLTERVGHYIERIRIVRLNELLLDSLPHPAMVIHRDRTILAANRIARQVGSKIGGICWRDFAQVEHLPEEHKQFVKEHSGCAPPGGTKCTFCLADDALEERKDTNNPEVKAFGRIWDTNWIPITEDIFLHYSIDITERKEGEEKLQEYHKQLQSLAARLSLTEAKERRDIASELHDHIGQNLALSMLKLAEVKKCALSSDVVSLLGEITVLIDQAIEDTQSLTFDLSFLSQLQEFGFSRTVAQWMEQRVQGQYGIDAEFVDDGQAKPMADDVCSLLFQAVRELLINVIKHAEAHSVKVMVQRKGQLIETIVQDDGVGCDLSQTESVFPRRSGGGFGLFSIRERLNYIGGQLEIESEIGRGTRVTLLTPLKTENATEEGHVH